MKGEVKIGLIGFGVVGSGTYELLERHKKDIEARVGARIKIEWLCSRRRKSHRLLSASVKQTRRWQEVVQDPGVDCVVELIGGTEPARTIVLSALKAGKHVVTANKAILSKHWNEIFDLAHDRRKLVYFEAAVGGGIPVVQALNEGLAANQVEKFVGILNGTTNFILTKMQESGMSYAEALKQAQAAGFAEADPTFDVEGIDAAQKVAILGSLATGHWVPPSRVHTEGISKLQLTDIRLIRERLRRMIKLLGIGEKTESGWTFRVHPTLVADNHPFANVRNEYNAVSLNGNAVGDVMLYGKGAGRFPTSSAVVSDIIFICRQIANGTAGRLPYVSRPARGILKFAGIEKIRCQYYLRVTTLDKPGVLAKITNILGQYGVSIASVHQDNFEAADSKKPVTVILVTHVSEEAKMQASLRKIDRLPSLKAKSVLLRME